MRSFILGAVLVSSVVSLKCYIAISTDTNFIPAPDQFGTCPPSSVKCYRNLVNSTSIGLQMTGAFYGCDTPQDSMCSYNGALSDCSVASLGACCCSTDLCNIESQIPQNNTTSAPMTTTSQANSTATILRTSTTTVQSKTTATAAPIGDVYCYNYSSNNLSFVPSDPAYLELCDPGIRGCLTTKNYDKNEIVFTCDAFNACAQVPMNKTQCQQNGNTESCCCVGTLCNGDPNPHSPSTTTVVGTTTSQKSTTLTPTTTLIPVNGLVWCYSTFSSDYNFVPSNPDLLISCNASVAGCTITYDFGANNMTYFNCDTKNMCQKSNDHCEAKGNSSQVCCCRSSLCNGDPNPHFPTTTQSTTTKQTTSTTVTTTALPAGVRCYSAFSSNPNFVPNDPNTIIPCNSGVRGCLKTTYNQKNQTIFDCDANNLCLQNGKILDGSSWCQSDDNTETCCCVGELCDGNPIQGTALTTSKTAGFVTVSLSFLVAVHNIL